MSRDTYPRHRYAVTFSVRMYVEAETEDKAEIYAEERLIDALDFPGAYYICEEVLREPESPIRQLARRSSTGRADG